MVKITSDVLALSFIKFQMLIMLPLCLSIIEISLKIIGEYVYSNLKYYVNILIISLNIFTDSDLI